VRKSGDAMITVEIIDSGHTDEAAPIGATRSVATVDVESLPRTGKQTRWATALHRGGGVGLSLVRGLVARELRGQFDIRANDQGGTTATVAFPLNRNAHTERGRIVSEP
jgi:two-component sensor histidine kinase